MAYSYNTPILLNLYGVTAQRFHQPTGTASEIIDAVSELATRPN